MQHHVFISYSRQDKDHMQSVRNTLRSAGLTVWTDEGIEVGTPSWRDMIENAIETTQCLVVILSPDAKKSRWVKSELDYAQIQGKRIFPILVSGDERTSIPFSLASSHYADMRQNPTVTLDQVLAALKELIGITSVVQERVAHNTKINSFKYNNKEKINIVIVDDIADTCSSIQKILSFETDFVVVGTASNGKEGLRLIEKTKPDVVLMDINMPEMDGFEATAKTLLVSPHTTVLMMSVHDDQDYMQRSMIAGARYFFSKPISMDELYRVIRLVHQLKMGHRKG